MPDQILVTLSLYVCLSVFVSVSLSLSVCLSVCVFSVCLSVCLSPSLPPSLSLSLSACLTKYSPGSNHAGPNNHQSLIGNICSAANTPGRGLTCFVNLQTRCWIDTHPRLKFRNTHKAGYSPSQRFYVYRTPGRKYTHQNMRLCIATVK